MDFVLKNTLTYKNRHSLRMDQTTATILPNDLIRRIIREADGGRYTHKIALMACLKQIQWAYSFRPGTALWRDELLLLHGCRLDEEIDGNHPSQLELGRSDRWADREYAEAEWEYETQALFREQIERGADFGYPPSKFEPWKYNC